VAMGRAGQVDPLLGGMGGGRLNLPKPQKAATDMTGAFQVQRAIAPAAASSAPPYGQRGKWVPRAQADFGDGGAYPECHVAQYPLEMGRKKETVSKTVPIQMDVNGKVQWDAVLKQGASANKLAVHAKPEDMMAKWSAPEDLERPTEEMDLVNTERTKAALELVLSKSQAKGQVQAQEHKSKEPEYIRYTSNPDAPGHNPDCATRVIRMVEEQVDPLQPPKFKHKRVPRGPGTPPPPVHHSPPRKLTQKDQKDWKIPPCVSNWKNSKGYTIPLEKRLQADGRGLQDATINDKFAALSEDLYLSERKAREEIKIRNDMVKNRKAREEELRERQLQDMAKQAREAKEDINSYRPQEGETAEEATERQARQKILNDRKREIERDRRMEVAGKKQKRDREEDRDISEAIALGQAAKPTNVSGESLFDARLFNQSAGLDSGYGDDDKYNMYDKPLFADKSQSGIYRHDKDRLEQTTGRLASVGNNFEGAEQKGSRTRPVEFEAEAVAGDDPFALNDLMKRAQEKR